MKILFLSLLIKYVISSIEECYNFTIPLIKEECLAIPVEKENGMMCCYKEYTCCVVGLEEYMIYTDKKKTAIEREILGYQYYIYNINKMYSYFNFLSLFPSTTYCSRGKITYDEKLMFKEEDKLVFQNENHCLHYHYKVLKKQINDVKEEQCENAILLQTSKDNNIACGFYNFKITLKDKTTINLKTCYLLNIEELEHLDKKYKENIFNNYLFDSLDYLDIEIGNMYSYTGAISDSKTGFSFTYSQNLEKTSGNSIIQVSKFLLFLFIFLLFMNN